jgi:predicted O-methyltransferase YrrM
VRFDIAVVNYNTDFHLLNVLSSIRRELPPASFGACHVWDNGSTDASGAVLAALGREVGWLQAHASPSNIHHGPALDRLLRDHCREEWVLVLDSDTTVRHDFRAALPELHGERPAFIGQVHPELSQLYAYMCHLLVNRAWYSELPSFDADGAPGRAFFRAVAARGIHWRRFRWVDHVEHHGQGTLRGVLERGETEHPLHRFAAEQSRRDPRWALARARERSLKRGLAGFLAERGLPARPGADTGVPDDRDTAAPPTHPSGSPPSSVRRRVRWDQLPFPASRVVRIAAGFGLYGREPEHCRLFRLVRRRRPRTVLEVGVAPGGTLFLWTRAAAARATLVSVGPPPWEQDDPGEEARRQALASSGRPRQSLHVLRDDPLLASARARVASLLAGRPLDFLFLTGEDDAERVRGCLEAYAPLVRPGGLVALDGIRSRLGGSDGLSRFWREVRGRARTEELVDDASRAGFGIGAVHAGAGTPPAWWRRGV